MRALSVVGWKRIHVRSPLLSILFHPIWSYKLGCAGKTVGSDKKLYKELEYQISMSKSPKSPKSPKGMEVDLSVSPFGPLTENGSKKTFMYLIATLNSSYFDYDFRYLSNTFITYPHTTNITLKLVLIEKNYVFITKITLLSC